MAFLLGFGPAERPSAPFYHLTAEMNSAYDNSPLRSELTRHSARPPEDGIYSVLILHVAADVISFAATFYKKSPLTHFVAAPFQTEPAALGFGLVFGAERKAMASIVLRCYNEKPRHLSWFFHWIPRRTAAIHPPAIEMLGGTEFHLRQGFACGKTLVTRRSARPPEGGIHSAAMPQKERHDLRRVFLFCFAAVGRFARVFL
ncbi:hypothetical protein [Dysosmobacter sp.]|uniref:hypothetical protein n=1 Tax=Dysosmobacter sp. TaxID=2591382 RepID=UPI002A8483BA|nr:hypothetical protein [Dysosmobacter sp.]MDY3281722.1 hypothetical protein [Dysosmobacter sp.]